MNIVLDSNVIVSDFRLGSSHVEVLEDFLEKTSSKLLISVVVVEEVVNRFKETLERTHSKAVGAVNALRRLTGADTLPGIDINVELEVQSYREYLKRKLEGMGVEYLDYPDTPHAKLVNQSLKRRKPFGASGRGYRDALIWDSIVKRLQTTPEQTVLVTSDTADFAAEDKQHLHQDLVEDLKENGVNGDLVEIAPNLGEFVKKFAEPRLKRLEDVRQALSQNAFPGLQLLQVVTARKQQVIDQINRELPELLDLPHEFENPEVIDVDDPKGISVQDVYELNPGELFIRFATEVSAFVDFFIYNADYYGMGDTEIPLVIWDTNWSEHYVWAGTCGLFEIVFVLTFDEAKQSVESFDIEEMTAAAVPLLASE